jgi:hypothetical protein
VPYLLGGERIALGRLTSEPTKPFEFPRDRPSIRCDIGLGERVLPVVPHTLAIDAQVRQFDIIWRGAHEYPGPAWLPKMRHLSVIVS